MGQMDDVKVDETLTIPAAEIGFEASRAGGPGGQHVNKSSTKVTVTFDIDASAVLDDAQRARIRERLVDSARDQVGRRESEVIPEARAAHSEHDDVIGRSPHLTSPRICTAHSASGSS